MARERPLTAAGAVTWRRCAPRPGSSGKRGVEVLLVHRPRYDDWTFPKGKPDPGEDLVATAVREVAEETAQLVRLGHPLPDTRYRVAGGPKRVSYWAARVVGETATPFTPNREIDDLRWVRPGDARRLLSYEHDLDLLDAFLALRDVKAHRTRTLVVVRHGKAKAREHWRRDDLLRPLTPSGRGRADALVPLLEAYGVRRVVSSPARRCVDTGTTPGCRRRRPRTTCVARSPTCSRRSRRPSSADTGRPCRGSSRPSGWTLRSWLRARAWCCICVEAWSSQMNRWGDLHHPADLRREPILRSSFTLRSPTEDPRYTSAP